MEPTPDEAYRRYRARGIFYSMWLLADVIGRDRVQVSQIHRDDKKNWFMYTVMRDSCKFSIVIVRHNVPWDSVKLRNNELRVFSNGVDGAVQANTGSNATPPKRPDAKPKSDSFDIDSLIQNANEFFSSGVDGWGNSVFGSRSPVSQESPSSNTMNNDAQNNDGDANMIKLQLPGDRQFIQYNLRAKYMTAPSLDSKGNVRYAGQYVERGSGIFYGQKEYLNVKGDSVNGYEIYAPDNAASVVEFQCQPFTDS